MLFPFFANTPHHVADVVADSFLTNEELLGDFFGGPVLD
jgi:hypothetical protein